LLFGDPVQLNEQEGNKMKRAIRIIAAFTLFYMSAGQTRADLVDTFNSENGGVGQLNYFGFTNWYVANAGAGGSVDLIGNGFFDFYPGNGLYVDLAGSTNGPGGLMTTLQTFGPGTYSISYDLAGSARGIDSTVHVNFGSFSQDYFLPSSQGYTLYGATVTLLAPAQLTIQNLEGGNIGAILDNVNVHAVPEPATLNMLGAAGICMAAGYCWRRRKLTLT
jgi:hypothetical protein